MAVGVECTEQLKQYLSMNMLSVDTTMTTGGKEHSYVVKKLTPC